MCKEMYYYWRRTFSLFWSRSFLFGSLP
jgi:hypothetical protein